MNLEITPDPTDDERAAIEAAFAQESEPTAESCVELDAGDCEEKVKP